MIFLYAGDLMTKQVFWTKIVLDAFIKEGNLNERQKFLIQTRVQGYTISKQAQELNLSVDQVNKDIAELKKIYDATQKYSTILPSRKKNKKDLWNND